MLCSSSFVLIKSYSKFMEEAVKSKDWVDINCSLKATYRFLFMRSLGYDDLHFRDIKTDHPKEYGEYKVKELSIEECCKDINKTLGIEVLRNNYLELIQQLGSFIFEVDSSFKRPKFSALNTKILLQEIANLKVINTYVQLEEDYKTSHPNCTDKDISDAKDKRQTSVMQQRDDYIKVMTAEAAKDYVKFYILNFKGTFDDKYIGEDYFRDYFDDYAKMQADGFRNNPPKKEEMNLTSLAKQSSSDNLNNVKSDSIESKQLSDKPKFSIKRDIKPYIFQDTDYIKGVKLYLYSYHCTLEDSIKAPKILHVLYNKISYMLQYFTAYKYFDKSGEAAQQWARIEHELRCMFGAKIYESGYICEYISSEKETNDKISEIKQAEFRGKSKYIDCKLNKNFLLDFQNWLSIHNFI